MLTNNVEAADVRGGARDQAPHRARLRVAIVSDLLEEQWPSMDLVADMLTESFQTQPSSAVAATQIRPAMRWRLSKTPLVGNKRSVLNFDRLFNRFVDYPRWLRGRAKDFDLFHIVDHSYSQVVHVLPPQRTVVTCHDLDTFRCLLDPEQEQRPPWFRAMARKILDGFRQAAQVIAVSQATCDQLLRYGLVAPERVSVVPNGVHPSCTAAPHAEADAAAAGLIPDAGRGAWLLSVGSTLPRKRLDVLLQVFARVHRALPQTRLVRVGGFTSAQIELIQELHLQGAMVNLPFLERDVLAAVYRRSTLLLHTADAEGFGLPLIEALACGCPVVASDLPVLREVGGPAASYCQVADIEDWQQTVLQLLDERRQHPGPWELRRQQGLAWASRFTWAENARQTATIYQKVMEKIK
jgi:glycosyltransferase involved in cell wall biosynthesis